MKEILPGLFLIDLDQPVKGFRKFISSWLLIRNKQVILVDPGPSSTILHLTSVLKKAGIETVDLILLTHIHIDHAGGTGLLLKKFPKARVICHPRAVKHLLNPEKLWAGSLQVLGQLAEVYGPLTPIPPENLASESVIKLNGLNIEAIETPGHASHHQVYKIENILFMGEVAGVNIPLPSNSYLRIATPPVFKYEIYKASLQKAAALDVKHLCFGHYGHRDDPQRVFSRAFEQLELWMNIISRFADAGSSKEADILEQLLRNDPNLKALSDLPEDIQSRERYFCLNSIKGILGYIQETRN